MSGTKPITHNVVRSFRGQLLYLVSLHANHGFRWVTDRKQALALSTPEEALKIVERASREYGAKGTVVDSHEAPHVIERAPVLSALMRAKHHQIASSASDQADAWAMQALQDVQNDAPRSSMVWREDRAFIGLDSIDLECLS